MTIRRGDIYFVDLNPVRGREQKGRRPVAVISNDAINAKPLVVTVVVGTSGQNVSQDFSTNVRVSRDDSGLPDETVFMRFQVRTLDHSRFPKRRAGKLSQAALARLDAAVKYCLDLR